MLFKNYENCQHNFLKYFSISRLLGLVDLLAALTRRRVPDRHGQDGEKQHHEDNGHGAEHDVRGEVIALLDVRASLVKGSLEGAGQLLEETLRLRHFSRLGQSVALQL